MNESGDLVLRKESTEDYSAVVGSMSLRTADMRFAGKPFQEWKATGQDIGSIVADPLFVNVSNFDFRLRPDSPALKMGFQQIDMAGVGPRVPAGQ